MARTASWQTTIPTRVIIKERTTFLLEATPASMVSTPASTVPTAIRPSEQAKMKRPRSDKKVDFVDINFNEPVNEVLVVLPLETTTVALAHHMYWIEA